MAVPGDKLGLGTQTYSGEGRFSTIKSAFNRLTGTNQDGDPIPAVEGIDYLLIFYRRRFLILACVVVCVSLALLVNFLTTPLYGATVVMVPSADENDLSGNASSALSGLSLITGKNTSGRKAKALALLEARTTIQQFITQKNLLPVLFAERWDSAAGSWKSGAKAPTLEDGYLKFHGAMTVDDDDANRVIRLRMVWTDPQTAADWANGIARLVNYIMQQREIARTKRMAANLYQELAVMQNQQLHTNIADLIEQQIRTRILAKSNDDYALEIVDPALPTLKKVNLGGTILAAIGLLAGLVIGIPLAFLLQSLEVRRARLKATVPASHSG